MAHAAAFSAVNGENASGVGERADAMTLSTLRLRPPQVRQLNALLRELEFNMAVYAIALLLVLWSDPLVLWGGMLLLRSARSLAAGSRRCSCSSCFHFYSTRRSRAKAATPAAATRTRQYRQILTHHHLSLIVLSRTLLLATNAALCALSSNPLTTIG